MIELSTFLDSIDSSFILVWPRSFALELYRQHFPRYHFAPVPLLVRGVSNQIFGLTVITYWQAFGIIIIAKLLFGAFNSHHKESKREEDSGKKHFKNWIHQGKTPWRTHKEEKKEKFSKWQHYDSYWENEGKAAFEEYVKRKDIDNQ